MEPCCQCRWPGYLEIPENDGRSCQFPPFPSTKSLHRSNHLQILFLIGIVQKWWPHTLHLNRNSIISNLAPLTIVVPHRGTCQSGASPARGQSFRGSTSGKEDGGGKIPRQRNVDYTRETSSKRNPLFLLATVTSVALRISFPLSP